jgi:hypothetical protein
MVVVLSGTKIPLNLRTLVLVFKKKILCIMSPTWVFSSLPVIKIKKSNFIKSSSRAHTKWMVLIMMYRRTLQELWNMQGTHHCAQYKVPLRNLREPKFPNGLGNRHNGL